MCISNQTHLWVYLQATTSTHTKLYTLAESNQLTSSMYMHTRAFVCIYQYTHIYTYQIVEQSSIIYTWRRLYVSVTTVTVSLLPTLSATDRLIVQTGLISRALRDILFTPSHIDLKGHLLAHARHKDFNMQYFSYTSLMVKVIRYAFCFE